MRQKGRRFKPRETMQTSEKVDRVMAAIAAVRAEVPFVGKSATVEIDGRSGSRKEKFAPFEEIAEAIKGPCERAGICWTQHGDEGHGGSQWLVTRIDHPASGQWIAGKWRIESARAGFREVGAAASYFRRIALLAAFGIVAKGEDPEHTLEHARDAKPSKDRVTRGARPVNAPDDIGSRIERAIEDMATAKTLSRLEEIGKTLRDEHGATLVPRSEAPRVKAAFDEAARRIREATP